MPMMNLDDALPPEETTPEAGGPTDFSKLSEALDAMQAQLDSIRTMLPAGDSAEEQSEQVDSATGEADEKAAPTDPLKPAAPDSELNKSLAIASLSKHLG